MFSQALIYLQDALRLSQNQRQNFNSIRSLLQSAFTEVQNDPNVYDSTKRKALSAIDKVISYTYSRTNPMPMPSPIVNQSFASMATPISPYQQKPAVFSYSNLNLPGGQVPRGWTQRGREDRALAIMIRNAINIVRQGL